MISAIGLIEASKPNWVDFKTRSKSDLQITATVSVYADHEESYELVISSTFGNKIAVKEDPVGNSLPEFCPELHINDDSTFCLGLRVGANVTSPDIAIDWWAKLKLFLECQCLAEISKDWPPGKGLSHGDTPALVHLTAIELATELNLQDVYGMGVDRNIGAFGEDLPRFRSDGRIWDKKNLFRHSVFARNIRSLGYRFGSKKKKGAVLKLIRLELLRRIELNKFWSSFLKRPYTCCGRASRCPFIDGKVPYELPTFSTSLRKKQTSLLKVLTKRAG